MNWFQSNYRLVNLAAFWFWLSLTYFYGKAFAFAASTAIYSVVMYAYASSLFQNSDPNQRSILSWFNAARLFLNIATLIQLGFLGIVLIYFPLVNRGNLPLWIGTPIWLSFAIVGIYEIKYDSLRKKGVAKK